MTYQGKRWVRQHRWFLKEEEWVESVTCVHTMRRGMKEGKREREWEWKGIRKPRMELCHGAIYEWREGSLLIRWKLFRCFSLWRKMKRMFVNDEGGRRINRRMEEEKQRWRVDTSDGRGHFIVYPFCTIGNLPRVIDSLPIPSMNPFHQQRIPMDPPSFFFKTIRVCVSPVCVSSFRILCCPSNQ